MQTLAFNNQHLLFVRVPMSTIDYSFCRSGDKFLVIFDRNDEGFSLEQISIPEEYAKLEFTHPLGTIQKSGGIVSTTIPDITLLETLGSVGIVNYATYSYLEIFTNHMQLYGLSLKEGDKYAVLKINNE